MADYKAPLRDIRFVMDELLDVDSHYQSIPGGEDLNSELRGAILEEAAKFSEQVLAPLRRVADEEGCQWSDEGVTSPPGFPDAYQQYVEGGWPGLSMPVEFGGQGLPSSMETSVAELTGQANHAWYMYPGLSAGCRETLLAHGTEEQQQTYLNKLVSGEWTGTMCLTEPQCGSDLSFLRTKAEPNADGSYSVTGTKIFISSGDHDMSQNIIHVVLARLPDAPQGTKGISLFVVPKYLVNEDGSLSSERNVTCGSLEHKMGIHGNATCVMNFDNSKGFLIGNENEGLKCMFTFMNAARVGTAQQGQCIAEVALQGALAYALEREAGRSLTGPKSPDRPADRLIVHPDVRRMILTIRAFSEGNRAFLHFLTHQADKETRGNEEQRKEGSDLMALLTPIAKGFMTETGVEAASIGVQVYGGHGYIREWGMEQNLRDSRITTLYEGTTGIQSLDLLGRKILPDAGTNFGNVVAMMTAELENMDDEFSKPLQALLKEWVEVTTTIGGKAMESFDEVGAASVDYLMYSGYVVLAWFWGRMATIAKAKLGGDEDAFYKMKVATARFYFARVLPRTISHKAMIEAGASSIMDLEDSDFDSVLSA